ncbi:MAG: hypothetical protein GX304_02225 [Clostridiales bacterium]|jgi:uncharacterized protein (DUF1786 family)|nr:hypothetical protein [Clostridiales bacterium]
MAKPVEIELSRLKKMLMQDKSSAPSQLAEVIKSDVYSALSSYMDLFSDDLKVLIDCDDAGYHVIISARTHRFKQIGILPKKHEGR